MNNSLFSLPSFYPSISRPHVPPPPSILIPLLRHFHPFPHDIHQLIPFSLYLPSPSFYFLLPPLVRIRHFPSPISPSFQSPVSKFLRTKHTLKEIDFNSSSQKNPDEAINPDYDPYLLYQHLQFLKHSISL